MLARVLSFGLWGIEAFPIEVEVDVSRGLPAVTLVGLADAAIRESKERVKSAIKNCGFDWPDERVTVSLAPSDIKKEGASFDLAIAMGILAATRQLNSQNLKDYCLLGELSLDGTLRHCRGILPISVALTKTKIKNLVVPSDNAKEAALASGVSVFALKTLREAVAFLNDPDMIKPCEINLETLLKLRLRYDVDFQEVKGQYLAKRALEVAVSGGHNLLMMWQ